MGSLRCQSQSTNSPPRRLHTTLPDLAKSDKKSHYNKLLCESPQEQLPVGGIASAVRQKCCRTSSKPTVPGLLQPVISCTQTRQPVATNLGSEQTEHLFENTVFQNGDPRDYKDLPPGRGVGDLHRLQRRVLPHTNKQSVQEVHALSYLGRDLSVQSTTLWSVHSPHGVYSGGQRGQITSNEKGYKNPPVPRRLVGQSQIPPNLSSPHTNLGSCLSRIGLASERRKIRAGTQTSFQFRRLPVRLERGQGQSHPRTLADPTDQDTRNHVHSSVSGPESNVLDRITDCHRKTSTLGPVTHETHTVASQEQLEGARDTGKDHPHSKITSPTSKMVAGGKQCYHRPTITPTKTYSANLYRRIKRRVGRSLKRAHGKGKLVTSRNKLHINYLELKAIHLALKEFQALCTNNIVLIATDNTTVVAYINKEVGPPMCPTVANTELVHQETGDSQSSTHSRPSERDGRQAIQTGPDYSNRMVPQPRGTILTCFLWEVYFLGLDSSLSSLTQSSDA